jgi:hypothetical protein
MRTFSSSRALLILVASLCAIPAAAREGTQEKPTPAPPPAAITSAANPKDVDSVDAIVAALYDVISGPAGERDWNRVRSLFLPDARLTAVRKKPDGTFNATSVTVEGYIERAGKYFRERPFYESELSRKVEQFGQEAHVFSTYESREAPAAKPFARGINSIQLFNDGKRWYCVSIFWDEERADNPLPAKYQSK